MPSSPLALCDQFLNKGYEIVRNGQCRFRGFDTKFVLGYLILLLEVYFHSLPFFSLRMRNAARGFPAKS